MNLANPRYGFCVEHDNLSMVWAYFPQKSMNKEIWANIQDGFSQKYDNSLNSSNASMFGMVASPVGKFGNMGFVKDDVVMILCYSNRSSNH